MVWSSPLAPYAVIVGLAAQRRLPFTIDVTVEISTHKDPLKSNVSNLARLKKPNTHANHKFGFYATGNRTGMRQMTRIGAMAYSGEATMQQ